MVKDKMKGLNMEGGSKMNKAEDLNLVDDNLKRMSK